ncbi:MAG: glycogen synthase GlgA [Pseudomonadota bacterium]|jgi:starch synthase|uniref:Glycogen synthase n=1 Tax=Caballeronia sordidicola TaxID=196367 RepID=A0A242N0V1_CABSO|nr:MULTISPECIES: glycogen synthase GlgA [Burkholderiaceae]MDP9155855.1 glycogen synthase GlgA [Pseudomonadota bacterium]AME25747.1 glycogen synthase [Burkholderia sp. PAMC 26561]AMM17846.1 glycogen synthase [Burkholderia sp. PAMC 28687]OTP68960.1 Glycogen synthase, ADP-glucose transglucosylase [Caballeronia sordidicola]OTP77307.1 Glycogen synthase, ADP-glucose transglucosylase [Caballeronia sordidicola]
MTVCVLHVAAEMYPLLKTGGLADVVGALPPAQMQLGTDARVVLPAFPSVVAGLTQIEHVADLGPAFGLGNVRLERGVLEPHAIVVYIVRADAFYNRPGNPYLDASHTQYADSDRRFALLGWAAARIAHGADSTWRPDVVHAHDWHAGLAPAYLRAWERTSGVRVPSVITVHNLAYQGVFPAAEFGVLQLPADFFSVDGIEFYGHLSFLKAGLFYADRITTVSPTYAREIQTRVQGAGLDGLLRTRTHDITGILNGVDKTVWNPATDTAINTQYSVEKISGKEKCKAALQERMGLARDPDALLFGVVSRLTEQKGIDLLLSALPDIVQRGGQLVVLGTGDPALENGLKYAAAANPQSVAVELGFDETLSHSIIAGSDIVMVPSRFEPCGLTQLYALAYGSLPLVHCVGGLADTVVDTSLENLADEIATGFVFEKFDRPSIVAAVRRAFALKARRPDWKAVVHRAMEQDFGWEASALRYAEVYHELTV